MIFRTLLLALVLSMGVVGCSKLGGSGDTWHGDANLAHDIAAGMSKDDVKGMLGEPSRTQEIKIADQSVTIWFYVGEKDNVNVGFDNDGVVNTVGLNGTLLIKPSEG